MATSAKSTALAAFIHSRGGHVHAQLELCGRLDKQHGVFAMGTIARGELLLRLPRAAVICACDDGAECDWMPRAARAVSPMVRTALYLMREQALGERSEWAPYLATLPAEYDTLEHWAQEDLEALRGTSVYDELSGLRDASGSLVGPAQVLWSKELLPLVSAHAELWPDASLGAFLRACAAVRTRGFYDTAADGGAAGPYLLPAVDMLNHARTRQATSLTVERVGARARAGGGGGRGAAGTAGSSVGGGRCDEPRGDGNSDGTAEQEEEEGEGEGEEEELIFSMEAERALAAGEEAVHTYDHFTDAQLLLTYGFVSARGEGALPTTARLPLPLLATAARATAQARRKPRFRAALPWDPCEAWAAKEAACAALLAPYDGAVGVSRAEPLPDALLTAAVLLLMPRDDFEAFVGGEHGGGGGGGEGGGGEGGGGEGGGGEGEREGGGGGDEGEAAVATRVPLLDSSVLEGEPLLAGLVTQAIVAAVDAAEARYAAADDAPACTAAVDGGSAAPSAAAEGARARRVAMAQTLVGAELAALHATRRAALRLLLDGEEDGEEDSGEEGEEGEEEEEEGEEEVPAAKQARHR